MIPDNQKSCNWSLEVRVVNLDHSMLKNKNVLPVSEN